MIDKPYWDITLEKFEELQDIGELKLVNGYFLELVHGLMGFFPALVSGHEDKRHIVVCIDKTLIEKVRTLLNMKRARKSKIVKVRFLYYPEKGLGFDRTKDDPKAVPIMTQETFDELVALTPEPFMWTPGLLQIS